MTRKRSFRKSRFGHPIDHTISQPHSNTIAYGPASPASNPMIFLPNSGGYVDPSIKLISDLLSSFSKMSDNSTETPTTPPCKEEIAKIFTELSNLKTSNITIATLLKKLATKLDTHETRDSFDYSAYLLKIAEQIDKINAPIGTAIPAPTSIVVDTSPNITHTTHTTPLLEDLKTMSESEYTKKNPKMTIEFPEDDTSSEIPKSIPTLICDKTFFNTILGQNTYDYLRKKYAGIFFKSIEIENFFKYLDYLTDDTVTVNPFEKNIYKGSDEFFIKIQQKDSKAFKDAFSLKNITECERTIKNAIMCYARVLRGTNNYDAYIKQPEAIAFQNLKINPTASTAKTQFGKKKSLKKRKKKV